MSRKKTMWLAWLTVTALLSSYYAYGLVGNDKSIYIPGQTTSGHYQVELACEVCHTDPFGGKDVMQKACVNCHGAELKQVDDSHPKSKFTDPRNADRVAILDARYCVTCHVEHVADRTRPMGVTLPDDFCEKCHYDIEEDRASHKDMAFNTCASAGCHNFHDNKALYEDFLVKHGRGEKTVPNARLPVRDFSSLYKDKNLNNKRAIVPLTREDAQYPQQISVDASLVDQWGSTAHAKSAVNCMDCHKNPAGLTGAASWLDKPSYESCKQCHELEVESYGLGKHGMRLAQKLTPMQPRLARQPMKQDADILDTQMDCGSCHGSHSFDTAKASVDACLDCHDDQHSKAYKQSPHYQQWQQSQTDKNASDTGVSCATCHLPRQKIKHNGERRTLVQHNQNHNLRPNEKMIRDVCLICHGLGFSIDALADPVLVANNFRGMPAEQIASIEMAIVREKEKAKEKKGNKEKKSRKTEVQE